MREYIAARTKRSQAIRAAGLNATILRPWVRAGDPPQVPRLLYRSTALLEAIPPRVPEHGVSAGDAEQMIAR